MSTIKLYLSKSAKSRHLATEKDLCTCSFLFGSPEAIITFKWRDAMDCRDVAQRIIAVVIDEAHCVSKWYVLCVYLSQLCICVCIHTCMLVHTQFSCTHKLPLCVCVCV